MSVEVFKKKISKHLKCKLDLIINENRSTMLNLLERGPGHAKLSIHRMFLEAPEEVISAVAHYVRGTKRNKQNNLILRSYIQSNLARLDYSYLIDKKKLEYDGRVYNLRQIYDEINRTYFQNKLRLEITWYGTWGRKNRSRVVFGQYQDSLKLIKIHRMLDDPFYPPYFVAFVVYHEMLHNVITGKTDARGYYRIHTAEFKKREQQFADYERAMEWEKKNKDYIFKKPFFAW